MSSTRDKFYNEAVQEAFYKLEPKQQETLDEMIIILCNKFPNMGVMSALELLSKIGIISVKKEAELIELLDIIERKTAGDKGWKRKQFNYRSKETKS